MQVVQASIDGTKVDTSPGAAASETKENSKEQLEALRNAAKNKLVLAVGIFIDPMARRREALVQVACRPSKLWHSKDMEKLKNGSILKSWYLDELRNGSINFINTAFEN